MYTVSIDSNYCHIQLFWTVYYTYNGKWLFKQQQHNKQQLYAPKTWRWREGERETHNIFKQLISIPSNYPIVSVVERACDLCHLKYNNKALNSANAKEKRKEDLEREREIMKNN